MHSNLLENIATSLANQSLVYIVYLVGIVLAIVRFGKYPKPALYSLLAFIGMLLTSIGGTILTISLIHSQRQSGVSGTSISTQLMIIGIVRSLIYAVCLGLLVAAVYAGRANSKQRYRDEDDDEPRERRERSTKRAEPAVKESEKTTLPLARAKSPEEPRTE